MKTPSASKHRLAAGRSLPKLDRYNGYSHQSHQDKGPGVRIRGTGSQIDQNCVQYEQNFEWLSEDSGCKQQLQPSTINLLFHFDVYDFDNLWKAIKIFVLITAKQKVWNICLSMTRVRRADRFSLPGRGDESEKYFWLSQRRYLQSVTMSIVSSQVPTRASLPGPPRQHIIGTNAPRHHYFPFFSASFCRE